jgi:type II secretion system protein C
MDEKRLMKLLWIVKAGLLAVLAYAGFEVAVSCLHLGVVLDPQTVSGEPRTTDAQMALPETHSPPDYALIAQSNLFTKADNASAAPPGPPLPQAPESMAAAEELGLTLIGTIAGGPAVSRAIILNTKTNTSDVYGVGDAVAAATVTAIQRDAVVLRRQGRFLVLKQCFGKGASREPKPPEGRPTTTGPEPAVAGRSQPAATMAATAESSRPGYMAQMFRQATIEPYVKNNRTEGLKISGLEEIPLAEMFGFKNGDVVQSINGQQLTSKQKAFQVLMKARTQPRVDIQLLRDGQRKALSFDL